MTWPDPSSAPPPTGPAQQPAQPSQSTWNGYPAAPPPGLSQPVSMPSQVPNTWSAWSGHAGGPPRRPGVGGTVALFVAATVLGLPSLLFGLLALIGLADTESSKTATGTVVAVTDGTDLTGNPDDRCYEVDYTVPGGDRTYRHKTCQVQAGIPDDPEKTNWPDETPAEEHARFAAEHPVGSTVEVLYDPTDPAHVTGPIRDTGISSVSGKAIAVTGLVGATVFGGLASLLLFFGIRRLRRSRSA